MEPVTGDGTGVAVGLGDGAGLGVGVGVSVGSEVGVGVGLAVGAGVEPQATTTIIATAMARRAAITGAPSPTLSTLGRCVWAGRSRSLGSARHRLSVARALDVTLER
jgi:hypothetical protein